MPAITRLGDIGSGHACSSCPEPSHGRALAAGSPTVFINGRPAGRIGNAIDCGGTTAVKKLRHEV